MFPGIIINKKYKKLVLIGPLGLSIAITNPKKCFLKEWMIEYRNGRTLFNNLWRQQVIRKWYKNNSLKKNKNLSKIIQNLIKLFQKINNQMY